MSGPVVLLVENDKRAAQSLIAAFDRRLLQRPVWVSTGEDAVIWIRANPCDACLISSDLPGIDGLETYLRIRQRFPALPVVMIGGHESEQAAVAAFRVGVADYVPQQPGYQDVAVDKIHELVRRDGGSWTVSTTSTAASDELSGLLADTYQNKLRVIGRQLDLYLYQSINVMEVGGGILVRATAPGSRNPEALEFQSADFPHMLRAAISARGEAERPRAKSKLLPTGYEDFLRAVGYRLDKQIATAISITELQEFVAVGGVGTPDEDRGQTGIAPFQWLMYEDDITFLLNEADRRRSPEPEARRSTFQRLTDRR